jgi:hypothetical protein
MTGKAASKIVVMVAGHHVVLEEHAVAVEEDEVAMGDRKTSQPAPLLRPPRM